MLMRRVLRRVFSFDTFIAVNLLTMLVMSLVGTLYVLWRVDAVFGG